MPAPDTGRMSPQIATRLPRIPAPRRRFAYAKDRKVRLFLSPRSMRIGPLIIALAGGLAFTGALSEGAAAQTGRVGILIPGTPSKTIEELIEAGQLVDARQRLEQRFATEGRTARNLLLWGMILYRQEKYQEALSELRQSFSLNEKDPDLHKLMGLSLTKLEKPKLAEPFFQIAVELAPEDFMARFYLGLHNYMTNRFETAEAEFRRVIELQPEYIDGYCFLGLVLEELGREDNAIGVYEDAIRRSDQTGGKDEKPYFYLGRYYVRLQRNQESIRWLRRAIEVNPQAIEALNLLGKTLSDLGRAEEALPVVERAAEIDPEDPSPHYVMMRVFKKLGRDREAAAAHGRFLALEEKRERGEEGVKKSGTVTSGVL